MLLFISFLFYSSTFSQSTFFKTFGGAFDEIISNGTLMNTPDKGYILTGRTTSFGNGSNDAYLVRLDSLGDLMWSKTIGTSFSDGIAGLLSLPNGNIIVSGNYFVNGDSQALLAAFSPSGTLLWSRVFGNTGLENFIHLSLASNGDILAGGQTNSQPAGGARDVMLARFTQTGTLIWVRVFGGSSNDWTRNFYQVGNELVQAGNSWSFGSGQHDGMITKLNPNGTIVSTTAYGTGNDENFWNMTPMPNGDIVVSGYAITGYRKIWAMRLNSSGGVLWSKTYALSGSNIGGKVMKANDGNIIIFGYEVGTSSGRMVILKANSTNGNIIWAKEYAGNGNEAFAAYFQTPNGAIYSAGHTSSYGSGQYDLFLTKTDANGDMPNCTSNDITSQFTTSTYTPNVIAATPSQHTSLSSSSITINNVAAPTIQTDVCLAIAASFNISQTNICEGECVSFTDLSSGATSWQWTFTGANTAFSAIQHPSNICFPNAGTFDVKLVIQDGGLVDSIIQTVTVHAPPSIDIGSNTNLCQGSSFTLNATSPNATYLWSDNSTNSTLQITNSGTYSVEVTTNNCTAFDTIIVSVVDTPHIFLGNDTAFCDVNNVQLNAFTNNATYIWNDNSTQPSLIASQTGLYAVTATDANGCQGSDEVSLTFYQTPNVFLGNDTTICNGQNVILNASTPNGSYLWNDNSTNSALVVTTSGTYSVHVNVGTCSALSSINVSVQNNPVVNLGNDTTLCGTDEFMLNSNLSNISFLWNDGSTNNTLMVNQTGIYSLFISDGSNCTHSDTIEILYYPYPEVSFGVDQTICYGQELTLSALQSIPNSTYFWQDGSTNSDFLVQAPGGSYNVIVSANNCTSQDIINIDFEICPCNMGIPNAFTPDNDGNNDLFRPLFENDCSLTSFNLKIFNRWGQLVYTSNNENESWDGRINGQLQAQDSYVYVLEYQLIAQEPERLSGTFLLIR